MSTTALLPEAAVEDFPDWVNPFVVKELRQGLSSRIFVSVFVAVHVCVALGMIMGFLLSAGRPIGGPFEISHAMQWVVESICVCVLLPTGGYASVAQEIKADSLELIRVAGVTSGQIVMGKWQCQLALTTLLLVSVMPYHLLQYYLTHSGPLGQLAGLFSCWLMSLLISSMLMFYATLKAGGRVGCLFLGVPLLLVMMGFLASLMGLVFRSTGGESIVGLIVEAVVGGAGLLFFLSLAVSGFDMRVRAVAAPPFQPAGDKKDPWS